MLDELFKRLNDYSCIKENGEKLINELFHYTRSAEAVKNIATGCFWATDMVDFEHEDENEGTLIFHQVKELLSGSIVDEKIRQIIDERIGNQDKIQEFIGQHKTFVLSLCRNPKSEYMWDKYSGPNGYNLVFDKTKLIDSFYICLNNGNKREDKKIFKHALITYDTELQKNVIKNEYIELINKKADGITCAEKIDYILRHLMYVGNFYKSAIDGYDKEEEYRCLINTMIYEKAIWDELPVYNLNVKSKKHYIEIHFERAALKKIICASQEAREAIKELETKIPIELR